MLSHARTDTEIIRELASDDGTPCDEPLEAHLGECGECRRLAEALRPALELFQEAVAPEESRDLPGYWCAAASDGPRASVSYAPEVEPLQPRRRSAPPGAASRRTVGRTAWRMAAMLALGVTLGSMAGARWLLDSSAWSGHGSNTSVAPLAPRVEEPRWTITERMELGMLPAACFRSEPAGLSETSERHQLATIGLETLGCCSGCHHAASDAAPRTATAKVVQSCQLCHAGHP
jgi:hypothetical protein